MKKRTILVTFILIIALAVLFTSCTSYNDHTYTITVTGEERVTYGKDSKYLIYSTTSEGETKVLENTDNLFRGKFDSSDMYAEIEVGRTYEVSVVGFRFGLTNSYENIIAVKEVSNE